MRITPSIIAVWIIIVACTFSIFKQSKWKEREVLKHDMYVYYSYLPALFIYNDLSFEFVNQLPADDKREIWSLKAPNGAKVQKMTMGMAMMYAPAFGMAHLFAKGFGLSADGYSWIYHFFMAISALAFAIAAAFIQRRFLLNYFEDGVVALSLLSVFLATNVFYYSTIEGPMSHIHNFFLISVFIWQSIEWIQRYRWKNAIVMGITIGLIVLIRPVNALVVTIPLLYGVRSMAEQVMRLAEVLKAYKQLIVAVVIALLIIAPQLWYWHATTGQWIYYSYNDEGFFFNDPKIIEGLFGYRKGWIVYAPIMALSLIGLVLLFIQRTASKFNYAVIAYFVLHVYVTFSWWCWWYGGSLGARPMIDASAIMILPLAACYAYLFRFKFAKYACIVIVFGAILFNLRMTNFYTNGSMHWDAMTKATYWQRNGFKGVQSNYWELMDEPDYDAAKRGVR